jgi:tRNA G18 (ribose-2'-O)-methylase SpoU
MDEMCKNVIVCENIRSAYNVWVIIRTADGLGYDVVLSGYSPHPQTQMKVKKSSLGAENSTWLTQYWNTSETIEVLKNQWYILIALEITDASIPLNCLNLTESGEWPVALIVGNEKTWVLAETLESCDTVTHIPMQGIKASLNVAEAASIGMWDLRNKNKELRSQKWE